MQKDWTFIKELPNEEPEPIMTGNEDKHTQGNTWEYTKYDKRTANGTLGLDG